jgi:hypothetical protein
MAGIAATVRTRAGSAKKEPQREHKEHEEHKEEKIFVLRPLAFLRGLCVLGGSSNRTQILLSGQTFWVAIPA